MLMFMQRLKQKGQNKKMSHEVVSHEQNHAKDIAEFIQFDERLTDPTQRRDYFNQLDEDGFIDLVQQMASVVRTGSANALQHFDGEQVGLVFHEVPDQREKEDLLRKTWSVAKSYLDDNKVPDQDALDYAALTVAGGVLFAHPFIDGNGRTSRSLSYMISHGSSNPEELQDIMESGGGKKWSVTPEALVLSRKAYTGEQPTEIEWDAVFAGEGEDALGGTITAGWSKDKVLRQMIEEAGEHIKPQLDANITQGEDGKTILHGEKFIETLVTDPEAGMTNAKQLLDIYRDVRANYVHRFLDAMELRTPLDAHEFIKDAMQDVPEHASEFTKKRRITMSQEVGKRAIDGKLTVADRQLIRHKGWSSIRQVDVDEPTKSAV